MSGGPASASAPAAAVTGATDPVEVVDLAKTYHPDRPELSVHAVDGVSFSVARGDSMAKRRI